MDVVISDVLTEKLAQIRESVTPMEVTFSLKEINILNDKGQLMYLKMHRTLSSDFQVEKDIYRCMELVKQTGDLYRVLEFCVLKNKILKDNVFKVFPKLAR